jgi:Asp-tRNA(Asn)/Glu-tRNA(Gln) amidotransferase A subunit family amidase
MTDPSLLPAAEAVRRIATGQLSATALTEAFLARIAAGEPALRAFVTHDPAQALREAARRDASRAAGRPAGRLEGIAFGVKDVLDTAEQLSQYGSPIWAGHRPRSDAACVALARRAGAVILGKTVTTEFATRRPGPTANPANPAHTPGGSSSGSAAGAAAGFFHAGFGTQTAGSILRPAAFCGAVGFKPSYGTLHRGGMKVMSESLDTIGVITRSTDDAATVMAGLTGGDFGAPGTPPGRAPRLALVLGPNEDLAAPETRALFERLSGQLARAGASITPVALPPAVLAGFAAHALVMNGESAQALAWEADHAWAQLSPVLREAQERGRGFSLAEVNAGRAAFTAARAAFADMIAGYDAVLTPAAPGEAPAGREWTGDPGFNSLWTLLHVPCVSVPVGQGPRGLPLGAQVVTAFGADAACLVWGEWVRQAATA